MTGISDSANAVMLVPTGCWRGGSASVDYVAAATNPAADSLVRGYGSLTFASSGYSITRQVVLESASASVSVGDVVRGSMKFVLTDYYG